MKWKVMKEFNILPSSPIAKEMNDAQWVWCYLNIVEDQKSEEELWKARLKYMGLFVNPNAVKHMMKAEAAEKGETIDFKNPSNNYENSDEKIYNNSEFEKELADAFPNEEFIEIPEPGATIGNSNMSSEEFENFCINNFDNLDKYSVIQEYESNKKKMEKQGLDYDLDVIQIDE